MNKTRNWLMVLAALGAAGYFAAQTVTTPVDEKTASPVQIIEPATQSAPPTESDSTSPGSCGYTWARQGVPELFALLDGQIRALNEAASVRVEAFGEDCNRADGSSTFIAKETDFYIRLNVDDLGAEEYFGNFMAQVMPIISGAPSELIRGPKKGFVEFWFEQDETAHIVFRVPLQEYQDLHEPLNGADLFRHFNHPP